MTLLYKAFGEVGNNTLNSVNSQTAEIKNPKSQITAVPERIALS
jgi:hypothetical protein